MQSSALQEGTSTCAVRRNKSRLLSLSIYQGQDCHDIVMKRRYILCLPLRNQTVDLLGAKLIFFPPGTETKLRDPYRIRGNNYHNNDESRIRDIYFTQFKNERCQQLFYICSTSLFQLLTCPQVFTVISIAVSVGLPSLWFYWIGDSTEMLISVSDSLH
jgi:hypothetical protein